jgi:UDP-N-acetylmuramoyl-tripeptide--D-alanyl-D-alanine ligase
VKVTSFATDSREAGPGDLFIAIRGANLDGRDFLSSVQAAIALAEPGHPLVENPPLPVIVVADVVEALAAFGRTLRSQFDGPVVGVTGSVGKSTVKEFIAAALSPLGEIVKTEGNRNTEYTAPLLWAEVGPETKAVVVEMGMRGPGQIAHLASIAQPTIGVITNIGVTHLSELGSLENIARAKAEIIEELVPPPSAEIYAEDSDEEPRGTIIIWDEDPWREFLEEVAEEHDVQVAAFGTFDVQAELISYWAADWSSCVIGLDVVDRSLTTVELNVRLPVVGRHFGLGVAAALLVARYAGADLEQAAHALSRVQLPPMRMAVTEHEGITWVLDMYNAAPASIIAALETVAEVAKGPKYAVLGEMRELGGATKGGHREVGETLARLGFAGAITLDAGASDSPSPREGERGPGGEGPHASGPTRWIIQAALKAGMPASNLTHAASFEEVRQWLAARREGDTVLVKGSRGVELERVVPEGLTSA